ncbi:MAG: hypothetical protein FWF60_02470 [Oscillospiraceae bacterium]|nr:hypothetical protein [Oscillospiraceae bacterium]
MKKWKKVLRYVLLGLGYIALGTFGFMVSWLPRKLGVEWIVGWPTFLNHLLIWFPLIAVFAYALLKTLKQPLDEKLTKKKKTRSVLFSGLVCVFYIGMCIVQGFIVQWQKVDRYERSPSGKNKAVVMVGKGEADAWDAEYIYPVRAGLFYEDDNCIYLYPNYEDITFTWLDDNTLEITKTRKDSSEVETACLLW